MRNLKYFTSFMTRASKTAVCFYPLVGSEARNVDRT